MSDQYALARFLKEHREAKGLNHRQLSDAIKAMGSTASTQAVQQWENMDPAQRTTRPNQLNRQLLTEILECDSIALEAAYDEAKRGAREMAPVAVRERDVNARAAPVYRSRIPFTEVERLMHRSVLAAVPGAEAFLNKKIAPFDIHKIYNYLSPKLAVEWLVGVPTPPYFRQIIVESRLWRLHWLSRLDRSTGVHREYMLILVSPLEEPVEENAGYRMQRIFDSLKNELRMVDTKIHLHVAHTVEELGHLIAGMEQQLS